LWEKLKPILDAILLDGKKEYAFDFPNWAKTVGDPVTAFASFFDKK
jgi:hypothetical protein